MAVWVGVGAALWSVLARTHLAAFTGDAAIVVPRGFVPAHYAELILV